MKKALSLIIALSFIFALPADGFAIGSAGYENATYSARTFGQANAVVARPVDPTTVMFNPAGLVHLDGVQTTIGFQMIDARTFFRSKANDDHTQSDPKFIGLPSFHMSVNPGELLDNRVALGLGVNAPFGGANSYPARDPFGDLGFSNWLKMVATTIGAGFKVTDWLSIGGGVTYYNAYTYGQRFSYPNSFVLGVAANDGEAEVDTKGYAWGWNVGILMDYKDVHKFGFSYRSRTNIDMRGRAEVTGLVLGGAQGFPTFPNFETAISTDVPIPQAFTWGYAYEPSDKWAVEFDVTYTGWSDFNDQDYEFENPNAVLRALGTIPRNYDDTWSFHLGGHRKIKDNWDVYGGFAFYQAASPKKHVDNFIPDGNRFLWSLGTTYSVNDRLDIDFNYFFMLTATRHISNPEALARSGINIDGRFTSIAHGPFLTATYYFDMPFEKDMKEEKKSKNLKVTRSKKAMKK